jgi:hypothetical protein
MKVGIMQPYFFPYIGYWQLIKAVDKYVIYDDVNFIKGGWINRNQILMNGEAKMINLQMYGASPNKLINEVEISGDYVYNNKLLKTIESCYKKAAYFSDVYPIIENIISKETNNLAESLEYSIRKVCDYLGVKTELIVSSELEKNSSLRGQAKVIEICKLLGADEYYNAIGGLNLYSNSVFQDHGIKLSFLKTKEIKYKQFNDEFVPNLSIIDVMMFNSRQEINQLFGVFDLI